MARPFSSLRSVAIDFSFVLLASAIMVAQGGTSKMAPTSFERFWDHELPDVAMPEALEKMASPLQQSSTRLFLKRLIKLGNLTLPGKEFCSSAGTICSDEDANDRDGNVYRVCVRILDYGYGRCDQMSVPAISEADVSAVFFTPAALMHGNLLTVPDTSNDLSKNRFLPDSIARVLPALHLQHLPELMGIFAVPKGSRMSMVMESTLGHCSLEPKTEIKACHASGESMVRFVTETSGKDMIILSPRALSKDKAKVMDVHQVNGEGDKVITCHDMKFPSIVFSCHMTQTTRVLDVSLQLAGDQVAHALAVCHLDTSYWDPAHIAFKLLKTKPGRGTVCHWLPENSFVFIPQKFI